jgi:hypothetical protein
MSPCFACVSCGDVTLGHELGHVFCGHLGGCIGWNEKCDDGSGWPDRRKSDVRTKVWLRPYCVFEGAPGSTAAMPSGLMLKAKKVNNSLLGFPH